jgi:hypothetical protein
MGGYKYREKRLLACVSSIEKCAQIPACIVLVFCMVYSKEMHRPYMVPVQ